MAHAFTRHPLLASTPRSNSSGRTCSTGTSVADGGEALGQRASVRGRIVDAARRGRLGNRRLGRHGVVVARRPTALELGQNSLEDRAKRLELVLGWDR